MGNKVVLAIGLALAVFLASELISLERENTRLRKEAIFLTHESVTKGGMTKEDWKKIEKIVKEDSSDQTLKPQGFEAEGLEKTTEKRKEGEDQNKPQGSETPQQKLERLGFDPKRFHRVDATTTKNSNQKGE